MFFQTGIDFGETGTKKVALFALPLFSYYKILKTPEKGRKILVIPSQRVLLKSLPDEAKDASSAEKHIKEFLRFFEGREILWKLWWENGKGKVLFAEPETKLPKGAIWDAEPASLARAFLSTGLKDGEVWDFGETKVTKVSIKKGRLSSFRVFLEKMPEELAKESIEELPILLSGGRAEEKEVKEKFVRARLVKLKEVSPEKTTAFGAALWGVVGKSLPSFYSSRWELSPETTKKLSLSLLFSLVFLSLSLGSAKLLASHALKLIQKKENALFKTVFPQVPAISPLKQVKALIEEERKNGFYELLYQTLSNLPKEAKIFSITYEDGDLKVKIELPEDKAKELKEGELSQKVLSVKKLPGGSEILELSFSNLKL